MAFIGALAAVGALKALGSTKQQENRRRTNEPSGIGGVLGNFRKRKPHQDRYNCPVQGKRQGRQNNRE